MSDVGSERPPTDEAKNREMAIVTVAALLQARSGRDQVDEKFGGDAEAIIDCLDRLSLDRQFASALLGQRAGEGEDKELAREAFGAGIVSGEHFEDWWELHLSDQASRPERAGEPPTPDQIERAAKAMQAIGHDRWRGSVWEAGMGWRTLAWDEVRDDEKRFVRELARAALESRDGS